MSMYQPQLNSFTNSSRYIDNRCCYTRSPLARGFPPYDPFDSPRRERSREQQLADILALPFRYFFISAFRALPPPLPVASLLLSPYLQARKCVRGYEREGRDKREEERDDLISR